MGWFDNAKQAIIAQQTAKSPTSGTQSIATAVQGALGGTGTTAPTTTPTTTAPTAGSATTANPDAGKTWQQIVGEVQAQYPKATGDLINGILFDRLKAAGINVQHQPHGNGYSDDVLIIDGQEADLHSGGTWWPNPSLRPKGGGGTETGKTTGGVDLATLGLTAGELAARYGKTYIPPEWATEQIKNAGTGFTETYKTPQAITDAIANAGKGFTETFAPSKAVTEGITNAGKPFTETYAAPDWTNVGAPKDWTGTFTAPTAEQVRNTPGYQFAMQQGLEGVDTGAAAKGTLLTSGNQKNRLAFATGLADQTYTQAYQRALDEYQQAYNVFRENQSALQNAASTERQTGLNEYQTKANTYQNNQQLGLNAATTLGNVEQAGYNSRANTFQGNQQLALNAATLGANTDLAGFNTRRDTTLGNNKLAVDAANSAITNSQNAFNTNYNVWSTDSNSIFNRYNTLAGLGLTATNNATS